jgi:hypothetical protein
VTSAVAMTDHVDLVMWVAHLSFPREPESLAPGTCWRQVGAR